MLGGPCQDVLTHTLGFAALYLDYLLFLEILNKLVVHVNMLGSTRGVLTLDLNYRCLIVAVKC